MLSLLELPGYRKVKLKEISCIFSESFNTGLLPKDPEFAKRLSDIKKEISSLDGEEKDIIKEIIESGKIDKPELE